MSKKSRGRSDRDAGPPLDPRLAEVLRHLDPPKGFKPWHGGASVLGAIRGTSPTLAAWRPAPDRHSIWALALHVAYWDYAVWRRLTGAERGGFERAPSNFPQVPERPTAEAWVEDRRFVREWHARLAAALRAFDAARLGDLAGGSDSTTYADLVTGVLLHEVYHAGQIVMLKRLAAAAGIE